MSESIEHSAECLALAAEQESAHSSWVARWPKYCRSCHGWGLGMKIWSGDGEDYDVDPCESCSGNGTCPRCGEDGLTSETRGDDSTGEGPCKACGWDFDDGEPEIIGCVCEASNRPEDAYLRGDSQ